MFSEDGRIITATWSTFNATQSRVEFGTDPLRLDRKAKGSAKKFVDGGAEKRAQFIHRVQLKDLKPNTTYCKVQNFFQLWNCLTF